MQPENGHTKFLIVIGGPTAIGKTALAIDVAKHYQAEIISADSRQFYREMNIGTAKPSKKELKEVQHHFINNLSIFDRNYNAGKFEHDVISFLETYFETHDVAVMVGGSGLFINAVCSGFDSFETTDNSQQYTARNFLNTKDLPWLQQEVERLDPEYYAEVDKKNPVRLKRALEIIYTTGKKYSEQRIGKKAERNFKCIKIGLNTDREKLYQRINHRVDEMMKSGLYEEVKELYTYKKNHILNTVGYVELFDYIEDKLTLPEAVELIKQNTRNYAKRQLTWFKKDKEFFWFEPTEGNHILEYIDARMKEEEP